MNRLFNFNKLYRSIYSSVYFSIHLAVCPLARLSHDSLPEDFQFPVHADSIDFLRRTSVALVPPVLVFTDEKWREVARNNEIGKHSRASAMSVASPTTAVERCSSGQHGDAPPAENTGRINSIFHFHISRSLFPGCWQETLRLRPCVTRGWEGRSLSSSALLPRSCYRCWGVHPWSKIDLEGVNSSVLVLSSFPICHLPLKFCWWSKGRISGADKDSNSIHWRPEVLAVPDFTTQPPKCYCEPISQLCAWCMVVNSLLFTEDCAAPNIKPLYFMFCRLASDERCPSELPDLPTVAD